MVAMDQPVMNLPAEAVVPRTSLRGTGPVRRALPVLRRGLATVGYGLLGVAIVVAVWWAVSLQLGPLRLPDPLTVARALVENWENIPALQYVIMQKGGIGESLFYTVQSVLMTVALGGAVGTVVGIALPYVSSLRTILNPILVVLGTIPVLILLPFLIQWFGNGRLVLSGLVIVFTLVVITTVTQKSIVNAAGRYGDYARSLGASRRFEMVHVALPALVPDLVSGMRVALAAGWSLQTVAELVGGKHGSGRIIGTMANLSNTTLVIAMVLAVAVTAVVVDGIFVLAARRFQRWQT